MDLIMLILIAAVVLMVGISKSAFAGALGVFAVPLLMLKLPATQAIALMLPILIIGDVLTVKSYWRKWDNKLLLSLMPGAITGISLAYFIIDLINADRLQHIISLICILFSLKNLLFKQTTFTVFNNQISAFAMSALSGVTSSLVHAGGPPLIMYFSAIGLTPQKFIATASVFFAVLNTFKLIAVTSLGILNINSMLTALAFIPLALLGNWLGVKISASLNKHRFLTIMNYLLLSLGSWLLLIP